MAYPTTINFQPTSAYAGAQPINATSTTQNHPLNTEVRAVDRGSNNNGEGRFVYVKGVTNGATGALETRIQEATTGVQFENNGSVNVTVSQTFDRLTQPFAIRPNTSIPAGDYDYRRYTASFNTGINRRFGMTGNTSWGEFWNGDNTAMTVGMNVRPNYHLNVDLSYSRNQVTLPNGEFTTGLVGARFLYGFTPRAFFNAFLQYNADTNQLSSNLRFNFTHRPLSDLYLVYNDRRDTVTGDLLERAVILKLTNLFNF